MADLNEARRALQERLGPSPGGAAPGTTEAQMALQERLRSEHGQATQPIAGGQLGPPGLSDLGARFDVARQNTFKERVVAFQMHYPMGELVREPAGGELLFRREPSEPFAKVDAGMLERFEPLSDLIDLASEDVGAIAGGIATTFRSRGTNLVPLLLRGFAGAGAGELAKQGVEELEGTQQEAWGPIGKRAALQGAMEVGGIGAGRVASRLVEGASGRGLLGLKPGAGGAMIEGARAELPELMPQQVSDNPIIRRIAGQSATVTTHINRYGQMQEAALKRYLRGDRTAKASSEDLSKELQTVYERARGDALASAAARPIDASPAGVAAQAGIREWDDFASARVDDAYARARSLQTPNFDLTEPLQVAQTLERGAAFTTAEGELARAGEPVAGKLQTAIEQLRQVDPSQPVTVLDGKEHTVTDALRAIRSTLWDLKTPNPGELYRQEHRMAGDLYHSLTRSLEKPINADPGFQTAWRRANDLAKDRFEVWDKLLLSQVARHEQPALLARRLTAPNQVDNLKFLRGIIPPAKFQQLQDFAKADLIENADKITQRLAEFDKPTLNMLMSQRDQQLFKRVGERVDELNRMGIGRTIAKQSDFGRLVEEAAQKGDSAKLMGLHDLMLQHGGKDSALGKMLRAGIMQNVYARVVRTEPGEVASKVNFSRIQDEIARLHRSGASRFLTFGDVRRLHTTKVYSSLITEGQDTGTSLMGGQAVSGLVHFSQKAAGTLLHYMGAGRILTNPQTTAFLVGRGQAKQPHEVLTSLHGALGVAVNDFAEDGGL